MAKEIEVSKQAKNELPANVGMNPARLIEIAINQDSDIDKLEKLMELQIRWEDREAEKAFNEASSAFRSECPTIAKTLSGHNSKYAGLSETIDQIKPLLLKHGLSYTWKTGQDGDNISVTCKVTHIQGHSEETRLSAAPDNSGSKQPIQAIGSTVSYLQRYTLYAVLGLTSAEMDNDGQDVSGNCSFEECEEITAGLAELESTDEDENNFLEKIGAHSISEMTHAQYEQGVKLIATKKRFIEKQRRDSQ